MKRPAEYGSHRRWIRVLQGQRTAGRHARRREEIRQTNRRENLRAILDAAREMQAEMGAFGLHFRMR